MKRVGLWQWCALGLGTLNFALAAAAVTVWIWRSVPTSALMKPISIHIENEIVTFVRETPNGVEPGPRISFRSEIVRFRNGARRHVCDIPPTFRYYEPIPDNTLTLHVERWFGADCRARITATDGMYIEMIEWQGYLASIVPLLPEHKSHCFIVREGEISSATCEGDYNGDES